MISRRKFVAGAGQFAVMAALNLEFSPPTSAQGAAPAELMTPPVLGDMSLGNPNAAVTVIEYASLWCSHCGHFHKTVYPQLKKRYIDSGNINFIFREFPLNERGVVASMLARCAARQGGKDKFFAAIDTLFAKQETWAYTKNPGPQLLKLAKQMGFTEQSFNACIADQKLLDALEAEQTRAGTKFGVDATPTLFVNRKKLQGVGSIKDLAREIDPLLRR